MTDTAEATQGANISPGTACANCGHSYRDHVSGAACRVRDQDGDFCSCSLFQTRAAKALAALVAARTKDQFIHSLTDGRGAQAPLERPLPRPIGANCPDHPTFPLVIKGGEAWCRAGQHFWEP